MFYYVFYLEDKKMKKVIVMLLALLMVPAAIGSWSDDFEDEYHLGSWPSLSAPWEDGASCGGYADVGYLGSVGAQGPGATWTAGRAYRPIHAGSDIFIGKLYVFDAEIYGNMGFVVSGEKGIGNSGPTVDNVILQAYGGYAGTDAVALMFRSSDYEGGTQADYQQIVTKGNFTLGGWPDDFEREYHLGEWPSLEAPWEDAASCGGYAAVGYEGSVGAQGRGATWTWGRAYRRMDEGGYDYSVIMGKLHLASGVSYQGAVFGIVGKKSTSDESTLKTRF